MLFASVAALALAARRAQELFVLSVYRGRVFLVRGRLPFALYEALSDVIERANTQHATVRVVRDGGRARLTASGLDELTLQRARNVLGTVPFLRLATADWPRTKNYGQRLGVAWLARRLR